MAVSASFLANIYESLTRPSKALMETHTHHYKPNRDSVPRVFTLRKPIILLVFRGRLGAAGPFLAWATTSEEKYISLAAEGGTGILFGLTESSVLHAYKLSEGAAGRLIQEAEAEVCNEPNGLQDIEKSSATDDSDGDDRNELSWTPAICGGFFGGLVGMTLTCDSPGTGHIRLRVMAARASGTVTEWKIYAEREGKALRVSSEMSRCIHTGMPISCLGYIVDSTAASEHNLEEIREQRRLLGLADGTVAWIKDGTVRQACRVSKEPIKSLVGARISSTSSGLSRMNQCSLLGAAARADEVVWAAVCSNGEVTFFMLPGETSKEKTDAPGSFAVTVVKRLFLASWLAKNTPAVMPVSPDTTLVFNSRSLRLT
ncbi:hypothetical protein, conserved [Eimeria brunetti]|uniref:Uncharacterized protein n=1 Tax=Eimeria brunetti TaxID=51314 RepID=U6LFT9_9EIME|nr:hypothetical protein, conserved [Eimeria brunetti]